MNKKEIAGILIIVILIIFMIVSIVFPATKPVTKGFSGNEIMDELKDGDVIEEEFIAKSNYKKLGIPFANYGKVIDKGWFDVIITNSKTKEKKYKIKLGNIVDNEDYYIKHKLRKNRKYKIYIKLNKPKYPVTLYLTKKDKESITKYNGNKLDDKIRLSFMKYTKDYSSIWNCVFIISIVVLYTILIRNSGDKNEKK